MLSSDKVAQEVKILSGTSGTCTIEYYVSSAGVYGVYVTWEGQEIAGSPFSVPAVEQ